MAVVNQYGGTDGGSYAGYFTGRLTVTETSYSVANNTSTVYYKLELISGSSGRFSNYFAWYNIFINGVLVQEGGDSYSSQSYNTAQTIAEGTVTITHNTDGTKKNMSIGAILDFDSGTYSPGDFNLWGSMDLTTLFTKATISSAANFTHGDSETIQYSNPSGQTMVIGIFNTAGNTAYAGYRTCTGSSYTFNFTDEELDNFYKLFGTETSVTVRIYLRTTFNGSYYYDYKDVTITLKGNQKTVRTKVSSAWKRGKLWVNVSGTWKKAVMWTNVNGTWKKGI